MDECTEWELNDLVDLLPYCDRATWETARLNAYVTAQVNSKKKLSQQDICKFKWEDCEDLFEEEKHITEITDDDILRLQKLADQWQKE